MRKVKPANLLIMDTDLSIYIILASPTEVQGVLIFGGIIMEIQILRLSLNNLFSTQIRSIFSGTIGRLILNMQNRDCFLS
ncbi:hypothetical protein D3C73_650670 [compost metagenome]